MIELRFPDLSEKVVLIYLIGRAIEDAVVLENARFEVQGAKTFIVGEFSEGTTANDWVSGIRTAISWDSVEQYLIFDSLEDYFARVSRAYEKEQFH